MWPLSNRQKQILKLLAEQGPQNIYQISKKLNVEYSVAHVNVKKLEKQGTVKLLKTVDSQKGGKAKIYGLTLAGLCRALTQIPELWNKIDNILDKWVNLEPLIFGKWKYLRSKGPSEDLIKSLKEAVKETANREIRDEKNKIIADGYHPQKFFRQDFFNSLFDFIPRFQTEIWIEIIRGDEELKEWAIKETRRNIDYFKTMLYWFKEVEKALKGGKFRGWKGYMKNPD